MGSLSTDDPSISRVFNNKFISENKNKYNWYINIDSQPFEYRRLYASDYNDINWDTLELEGFVDIKNTDISKLKFMYADSSVHEFITVDVLKDSEGYKSFLNIPDNYSWLSYVVIAIIGLIVVVLLIIFAPKVFITIIKFIVKILIVLFKVVLWLSYLIFVAPFQAIAAKKNNTDFKLWNPFNFK